MNYLIQKIMLWILKKYFKTIHKYSEITSTKNISYFNYRAERINKIIHNRIKKPEKTFNICGIEYYDGLELICKKHYKNKKCRLYVNYVYVLKYIDTKNKEFTIIEPVDNVKMTFDLKMLDHFKLSYCSTCHSVQGLTRDDEVTIFDCNTPYVSRNFIWTAITRVRELKNVTIFEHCDQEVQKLTQSRKEQYFKMKIENYKKQDIEGKRDIDKKDYINTQWFYNEIDKNKQCSLCNVEYYTVLDENNNVCCNITADRIDNDVCHSKENCRLLCVECNRSKK